MASKISTRTLAERAPVGPWLFPEDQIMDAPARVLAAEITREKAFLRLHDELPYELIVETEAWEERKDGSVKIDQTIFVARESQRKIAIGAGGQSIKTIGELARAEMEAAFARRVHLFLHVKLRENWTEERALYARWGWIGMRSPRTAGFQPASGVRNIAQAWVRSQHRMPAGSRRFGGVVCAHEPPGSHHLQARNRWADAPASAACAFASAMFSTCSAGGATHEQILADLSRP